MLSLDAVASTVGRQIRDGLMLFDASGSAPGLPKREYKASGSVPIALEASKFGFVVREIGIFDVACAPFSVLSDKTHVICG